MPLALTLGDLNNDALDELAFGRQFLTIEHYGSGNYKARISANSDGESESRILWDGADIATTESVSPTMSALRPCDIDGDGVKELVGEYRYEYGWPSNMAILGLPLAVRGSRSFPLMILNRIHQPCRWHLLCLGAMAWPMTLEYLQEQTTMDQTIFPKGLDVQEIWTAMVPMNYS